MSSYEENYNKLRDFQKVGVKAFRENHRFILADDQGIGKTCQALMAIGNKALIICPKRLKKNWAKEIKKWRPELKVIILKKIEAGLKCPNDGEVVITNSDILPDELVKMTRMSITKVKKNPLDKNQKEKENIRHKAYITDLAKIFRTTTLIIDEAHKYSSMSSMRANKIKWLSAICGRVWVLTGTPMKGGKYMKLFDMLNATSMLNVIFGTQREFLKLANLYYDKLSMQYVSAGPPHRLFLEKLSKYVLRRKKEDVVKELPSKSFEYIPVEIEDKDIKRLLDDCEKYIDYDSDQLPSFEEFSSVRAALAKAKLDAAIELIEEYEYNEIPVLVFSMHTFPLEAIGNRPGWAIIKGDTSIKKSDDIVNNQANYKGIALSIKSADVGLTLTHFNQVIFIDTSFDTTENNQAFDRVHRISQTSPVNIKILVADHKIEHHTLKLLAKADKNIQDTIESLNEI